MPRQALQAQKGAGVALFFRTTTCQFTLAAMAGALVVGSITPAAADCSTSGTIITCTGDLSGGETIDVDSITEVLFEDLTADTGQLEITATGDDGDDGDGASLDGGDGVDTTAFTASFDGSSTYGAENSTGEVIVIDLTGGSGGKGGETEGERAGNGGDGGSVGASVIEISNAEGFEGESVFTSGTTGGDGGKGGESKNTGTKSANAGDGGDGGDGGDQTIEAETGSLSSMSATDGALVYLNSQGGDGGEGGEAKTQGINGTDVNAKAGGTGGDGGVLSVSISTTATGVSTADDTPVIRIESLGGDGGDGGEAVGGFEAAASGGDGGDAGAGGDITVDFSSATITTSGESSIGVFVRSYGGAGGSGGSASSDINSSDGGAGVGGGISGDVEVEFGGSISTSGDDAGGILVQSVGGYAGDAGSASGIVSYGAGSESGGAAGLAEFTLDSGSAISTGGDGADGVFVQSIGGGGGKGSNSSSAFSSLGGEGSAGGDGGTAEVTINDGVTIGTTGDSASAVFAQSVGGGGGSGGSADGISSIGGSGGSGGDGGEVTLTVGAATITTEGVASDGIYASSNGGGGGVARSTGGISAIGGSGGDGGDAGTVTVELDGTSVSTSDDDSDGVFIQSVGGGGGSGSSAVAIGLEYSVAVGGSGGDGGDGGDVTLDSSSSSIGSIITTGDRARGLVAQSVGGGGGDSGNDLSVSVGLIADYAVGQNSGSGAGGDGGEINVDHTYFTIVTSGDHAHGIQAQSIGGGGGSTGTNIAVSALTPISLTSAVGSSAGDGGDGGVVTVTVEEDITTGGDRAIGVIAQSIGGGGGVTGTTIGGSAVSSATITSVVGGSGGDGGTALAVTVTVNNDITTTGDSSGGIVAQSIGGGGGSSGWTADIDLISSATIENTVGGSGGSGGDGGRVEVYRQADASLTVTGDNSVGILAQSIGGGGGDGSITITGSVRSSATIATTTGGSGGDGGDGGQVIVVTEGDIITEGVSGVGILAQSIGNSGGNSALTVNGDAIDVTSVSFTNAGNGGDGGNADAVTVDSNGTITTSGDFATGLVAQSIAGGGGSSTGSLSGELTMAEFSTSVGGSGGGGGTSGLVTVKNTAEINTAGIYAYGILAQSIGGDGGSGGYAIDGSVSVGEYTADVNVAVGGSGGEGNASGDVEVTNTGAIETVDYGARGIMAQSIGGSGGSGGSVISGVLSISSESSFDLNIAVGGDGGAAGVGGDVTVNNSVDITTGSFYADAIFAQSVGGDGGTGGSSLVLTGDGSVDSSVAIDVSVGGSGGDGAVSGDVYVQNSAGTLTTVKSSSSGIYAQSIGGNGGQGGASGTLLLDLTTSTDAKFAAAAQVAVGGSGGTGGDAGAVTVDNEGVIQTSGVGSRGIFAQSVGGGGGDGGLASAFTMNSYLSSSIPNDSVTSLTATFALGGSGGAGGDGNTVTVTNTQAITTAGAASYGIYAQSVGGGGGNGGDGAVSMTYFVDAVEDAIVAGDDSDEPAWQEYVFGGTNLIAGLYAFGTSIPTKSSFISALTNFSVDVGGSGGASGDGDDVTVTNNGDLTTTGDSGTAIYAQSVGGGGGSGGDGSGSTLTDVSVGGQGSGGGNGGAIYIDNSGAINTSGQGGMGIYAQSVGGGGGTAGDIELAFGDLFNGTSFGLGVAVQEDAGDGGDGGAITIVSAGAITSTGDYAHGIWAQSVGGSGGASGTSGVSLVTSVGNAGDEGDSGDIDITVSGTMALSGDYAVGIFAQSVGGTDSDSGDIAIDVEADISSSGTGGRGIVAQSDAYGDSGDVTITIAEGVTVSTGGTSNDAHEPILILFADTFTLTNAGTISTSNAFGTDSSYYNAITSDAANSIISNSGTISGSIDFSGNTSSTFTNETGGTFETGLSIDLGDDGELVNNGTISPGGVDNIFTTYMIGNLSTSSSGGTFLFDVELGDGSTSADADNLVLETASTEQLPNGTVSVNLTGTNLLTSGDSGSVNIMFTDTTKIEIDDLTVSDTATVDYTLSQSDNNTAVTLGYTINYTDEASALDDNQTTAAGHVEDLVRARVAENAAGNGDQTYAFVEGLMTRILQLETVEDLQNAYSQLAPGSIFAAADASLFSSLRFAENLNACPAFKAGNTVRYFDDGACAWVQASATLYDRGRDDDSADFDEKTFGYAGGVQFELDPGWFAGVAVGYEYVDLSNASFGAKGNRFQAGASLRREFGATALSGSVSGGFSDYDFTRTAFGTTGAAYANSNPGIWWVGGHAKIGHAFALTDRLTVDPSVDIGVTHVAQHGFNETGSGAFLLQVGAFDSTIFSVNPTVDFTAEFNLAGMPAKATLHTGLLALAGDTDRATSASFTELGDGGPELTLIDNADTVFGEVGFSVEAILNENTSVDVNFDTLLSSGSQQYSGMARFNFEF